MKNVMEAIKSWLYRLFIENDYDRMNRERQEQGKPPIIYW